MKDANGMNNIENIIRIHGIYKHFKGNYYILEDIAIHSETGEKYAVYRQLYDDCQLFVRPLEMFLSKVDKVKYPEVKQEYRFELQPFYKNFLANK